MEKLWRWATGAKGPSGFGSRTTAEEVTAGIDMSGKTAVITGGSSGLGEETARVLALHGTHVILAVRNTAVGEEVRSRFLKTSPSAKVDVMELDLSSLASVRTFADNFKSRQLPLNVLINNAGLMMAPFDLSGDGHELHFATNHLGHFLLTKLLLETLKAGAVASGSNSRIINVASMVHQVSYAEGIRFGRLNDPKGYTRLGAYAQSKLANVLHAKELARKLQAVGVTNVMVNALCPGAIFTKLQRHLGPPKLTELLWIPARPILKSTPQGAATTCYVATNPALESVSGEYFYDCNVQKAHPHAMDEAMAAKLWVLSEEIVAPFAQT